MASASGPIRFYFFVEKKKKKKKNCKKIQPCGSVWPQHFIIQI
jgi:hypothetical protein